MMIKNIKIIGEDKEIQVNKGKQRQTMTEISEFDPIAFTCFMAEIAKKTNIELMSDITQNIYELYEGSYDNYTLFELIHIVRKSGYNIDCLYNKIDIINMIETRGYNIPRLKEKMQGTTWDHVRILDKLCQMYINQIKKRQNVYFWCYS